MRTPAELTEAFRARGGKVTPQRQCIVHFLFDNPTHPTAEAVYAAAVAEMPTISLRTVYQTLNELVDMGEIGVLNLGPGSSRFDPNTAAHHHLVCERCGQVRDVYLDAEPPTAPRGATAQGFRIRSAEIVFRGMCDACATNLSDHN